MKNPSRYLNSRALLALTTCLSALLVAVGCGGGGEATTTTPAGTFTTLHKGTLTVGSHIPYPPFEFGRAPKYEGFDIDVVNEITKRLGLDDKFVNTRFATILDDLANGKFDMVASATTITPAREKKALFSDPYLPVDQSLMVKRGSDITAVADVKGKIVGAQTGTTGADYAKKRTRAKTVRPYESIDDAFNALAAGQVDAVINDFPISKYAEKSHPDLEVVETLPTGEQYGFAFPMEADYLQRSVNNVLTGMKGDGTYTKIYRKWFNVAPPSTFAG